MYIFRYGLSLLYLILLRVAKLLKCCVEGGVAIYIQQMEKTLYIVLLDVEPGLYSFIDFWYKYEILLLREPCCVGHCIPRGSRGSADQKVTTRLGFEETSTGLGGLFSKPGGPRHGRKRM